MPLLFVYEDFQRTPKCKKVDCWNSISMQLQVRNIILVHMYWPRLGPDVSRQAMAMARPARLGTTVGRPFADSIAGAGCLVG